MKTWMDRLYLLLPLALLLFLTACSVSQPFGGLPDLPKPPADAPLQRGAPPAWRVDEALLTDDYLSSLVVYMEAALESMGGFTFSDPEELTSDQLYNCFIYLTSYEEHGQFLRQEIRQGGEPEWLHYFPVDFIVSRLSERFKRFHLDTATSSGYDPQTDCIVSNRFSTSVIHSVDVLSKTIDGNIVTFTVGRYLPFDKLTGKNPPYFQYKTYTIEFYDGGCYYLSASVLDEPPAFSLPDWTVYETDDSELALIFNAPLPAGERGPDGRLAYPWSHLAEEIHWIALGDGITDIPEEAFRGFTALERVAFPDTLQSIGPRAFADCICFISSRWTYSSPLPDGLETIGEGAFAHCISLKDMVLPASLTTLAPDVFSDCVALRELILPEGLTTLEDGCLRGCSSLSTLTIPASVTYVGEIPTKVLIFQGEPPQIAQENGVYLLEDYTSLYYPEGSAAWAALAAGCRQEKLFWVEGPSAVTWDFDESSGTLTFSGFGALTADELQTNEPHRPYDWTYLREKATALVFEEGITRIPYQAFYGFSSVTSVSLPSTLRSIGSFGLADCAFEELILPDGLESIDAFAFTFCRQLRRCEIPAGVRAILEFVFQECISMHTLTLHEGVLLLEEEYLRGCDSMHELTIPDGVEFIGHSNASTGLSVITFLGNPPLFIHPFAYANDTMYYPEDSAAWRKIIEKSYQERPNWVNSVWIEGLPENAA